MLSTVTPLEPPLLAHSGAPLEPHDLWWAWDLDPLVLVALGATAALYWRGWRPGADGRARRAAFGGGMAALFVALVSPLEALSGVLASAHMVQHVLLILVAAPLLAFSAPGAPLLRASPPSVRQTVRGMRRGAGIDAARIQRVRQPVVRWIAYVATLWLWHASVLYGAAVEHEWVHVLEHATFLAAAFLVWSCIVGPARVRVPRGIGILAVFTLALQSVFLSALLTFAGTPWYEPYHTTAPGWGLDPLTDQHLAGVLMWVPAGLIHVGIALALFAAWFRELDRSSPATSPPERLRL